MFRNLVLAVAIFGLGWGASFGAGMAVGKRQVPAPVQAATVAGGSQGAAAARGITFGTLDKVDGNTLTVNAANNQQVKVTLTGQTQILKQAAGTPADLTLGQRVTIQPQGQPAADGSVIAATVNLVSADAQLPGAQRGQGAQGGQGGQGRQQGG